MGDDVRFRPVSSTRKYAVRIGRGKAMQHREYVVHTWHDQDGRLEHWSVQQSMGRSVAIDVFLRDRDRIDTLVKSEIGGVH